MSENKQKKNVDLFPLDIMLLAVAWLGVCTVYGRSVKMFILGTLFLCISCLFGYKAGYGIGRASAINHCVVYGGGGANNQWKGYIPEYFIDVIRKFAETGEYEKEYENIFKSVSRQEAKEYITKIDRIREGGIS